MPHSRAYGSLHCSTGDPAWGDIAHGHDRPGAPALSVYSYMKSGAPARLFCLLWPLFACGCPPFFFAQAGMTEQASEGQLPKASEDQLPSPTAHPSPSTDGGKADTHCPTCKRKLEVAPEGPPAKRLALQVPVEAATRGEQGGHSNPFVVDETPAPRSVSASPGVPDPRINYATYGHGTSSMGSAPPRPPAPQGSAGAPLFSPGMVGEWPPGDQERSWSQYTAYTSQQQPDWQTIWPMQPTEGPPPNPPEHLVDVYPPPTLSWQSQNYVWDAAAGRSGRWVKKEFGKGAGTKGKGTTGKGKSQTSGASKRWWRDRDREWRERTERTPSESHDEWSAEGTDTSQRDLAVSLLRLISLGCAGFNTPALHIAQPLVSSCHQAGPRFSGHPLLVLGTEARYSRFPFYQGVPARPWSVSFLPWGDPASVFLTRGAAWRAGAFKCFVTSRHRSFATRPRACRPTVFRACRP